MSSCHGIPSHATSCHIWSESPWCKPLQSCWQSRQSFSAHSTYASLIWCAVFTSLLQAYICRLGLLQWIHVVFKSLCSSQTRIALKNKRQGKTLTAKRDFLISVLVSVWMSVQQSFLNTLIASTVKHTFKYLLIKFNTPLFHAKLWKNIVNVKNCWRAF